MRISDLACFSCKLCRKYVFKYHTFAHVLDPPKYYVEYFPENMTDVLKNCEEDADIKIFDFEL